MRITLCGSARFENPFKHWNKQLSLAGHVVHTLACYPSDEGGKNWYTPEEKKILDEVYLRKIDDSDAIVVLNIDGYIGEGLAREIEYAAANDKHIFYAEGPDGTTKETELPVLLHELGRHLTPEQWDERSTFERDCRCHTNPPCSNCIEHSNLFPEEF